MGLLQHLLYYWNKEIDPRVIDLPLIRSSYQLPLIVLAYLYFVTDLGPQLMKYSSPFSLKTFMKLYDIVQIMGNAWLVYDTIDTGLFSTEIECPNFNYSYDYFSMRLTRCAWHYFLLKILDLTETIIFVLRKKNNQISTLHLYHHVSTILFAWLGVRYYIITPIVFACFLNSFIHVIMYTYYFLATWGPDFQKFVAPMKQCITIIQMIQLIIFVWILLLIYMLKCKIDYLISIAYGANIVFQIYMFFNFYRQTYKKHKKIL